MKLMQVVAKRTRFFLDNNGWSVYKLSRETGLTPNGVQIVLQASNKDVKLSTLILIANAFNMTVSEFLNINEFKFENLDLD